MPTRGLQRLLGRLVTSPLAFLVAGVIDWSRLCARWAWARARGREVRW